MNKDEFLQLATDYDKIRRAWWKLENEIHEVLCGMGLGLRSFQYNKDSDTVTLFFYVDGYDDDEFIKTVVIPIDDYINHSGEDLKLILRHYIRIDNSKALEHGEEIMRLEAEREK